MPVRGKFELQGTTGGYNFKVVEGYRIAAALTSEGLGGRFFVHVLDRWDARFPASSSVAFDTTQPVGKLQLGGDGKRTYVFNDIVLRDAVIGATRRERYRQLEFEYEQRVFIEREGLPINLENTDEVLTLPGLLKDDYKYQLSTDQNGIQEHLLGFSVRLSHHESVVMRFVALRNKYNSFMQSAVEMHNATYDKGKISDLTIQFSQGPVELTSKNLRMFYVEEVYGEFLTYPSMSLSEAQDTEQSDKLIRAGMSGLRADTLLDHDSKPGFSPGNANPLAVEIATAVFHPGYYRNMVLV